MKTWISRFACVAVLAVTTSAFALTLTQSVDLPGVDGGGNLAIALGAPVNMKVNVNVTTGAFRASGRGKVQNMSGAKQTYKNPTINIPGVSIFNSNYTVAKNGKCTATASGVALLRAR